MLESHPDNPRVDLRLACPFHDLEEFARQIDFDIESQRSHVPYPVILLKCLSQHPGVRI